MKKLKILIFLCLALSFSAISPVLAQQTTYFAKVQSSGVYLCSTPSENSPLFEVPSSYFVKVEGAVDDYFKVTYLGVSGYVKKSSVSLMSGTPQNPYASATFKIFVAYSLFETPSQNSAASAVDTSQVFTYYGTRIGQAVSTGNNIWYYASTTYGGQTTYGYIFSGVTDGLSQIPTNTETFSVVSDLEYEISANSELQTLSTGTKILLIISISVPSALILYFLVKPSKITNLSKTRKKVHAERKKVRHGDYFEFEESDL
jgi:hypothetical protein